MRIILRRGIGPPDGSAEGSSDAVHLPFRPAAAGRLHDQARRRQGRLRRGLLRRLRRRQGSRPEAAPRPRRHRAARRRPVPQPQAPQPRPPLRPARPTTTATLGRHGVRRRRVAVAGPQPPPARPAARTWPSEWFREPGPGGRLPARPRHRPPRPQAGATSSSRTARSRSATTACASRCRQPAGSRRRPSAPSTTWPRRSRPATTTSRSTSTPAASSCYEMLTGKVPFDGERDGEILMKHLTATPDLTQVPAAFRPVVAQGAGQEPDPAVRHDGRDGPGGRGGDAADRAAGRGADRRRRRRPPRRPPAAPPPAARAGRRSRPRRRSLPVAAAGRRRPKAAALPQAKPVTPSVRDRLTDLTGALVKAPLVAALALVPYAVIAQIGRVGGARPDVPGDRRAELGDDRRGRRVDSTTPPTPGPDGCSWPGWACWSGRWRSGWTGGTCRTPRPRRAAGRARRSCSGRSSCRRTRCRPG